MKKCNLKRLIPVLLAILLLIPGVPTVSAESGSCGENLQWEFTGGTLTVTGSGAMADYSEEAPAPWYAFRDRIVKLSLPEGLTRVGSYAFAQCTQLQTVTLPDTVTEVGESGFFACERLQFLTLNAGLKRIEDSGFERCLRLQSVVLPYGLESIGYQAFWRCESLLSIHIPTTVTHLDMAVFAYCYSLVRAQIDAPIRQVPQWLFYSCTSLGAVTLPATVKQADEYAFYGCQTLNTVYHPGNKQDTKELVSDIADYLDGFSSINVSAGGSDTATSVEQTQQEDTTQLVNTTVTKTENAELGTQTTQTIPQGSTKPTVTQPQINATVTGDTGWGDVVEETEKILENYGTQLEDGQKVPVTVLVPEGITPDPEQLAPLAGKPVELTLQTAGGNAWTVDCSALTPETLKENLALSYTLTQADAKWSEKLGGAETYLLQFHRDMQINAQVRIRIPTVPARANAFLYQRKGNNLQQLQAVVVDDDGYAHFYLAAVDTETQYYIGINVTDASVEDVLIPQSLQEDYLIPPMQSIDYVITGRKSSWGMNIGQITWILVGVVLASVAIVGGVLFALNKRKLKNGYIPDIYEEDE